MTEAINLLTGHWLRFFKYQIVETASGRWILPAPDSKWERYDVWQAYEESRLNGTAPPYQSLLKLLTELQLAPVKTVYTDPPSAQEFPYWRLRPESIKGIAVDVRAEDLLINWCQDNGLLGVHQQRTVSITMPPYAAEENVGDDWLVLVQEGRTRLNGAFAGYWTPATVQLSEITRSKHSGAWDSSLIPDEVLSQSGAPATRSRLLPRFKWPVKVPKRLTHVFEEPHALVAFHDQVWRTRMQKVSINEFLTYDFPLVDLNKQPMFFCGHMVGFINDDGVTQSFTNVPWAPERADVAAHLGENIHDFLFWALLLYQGIAMASGEASSWRKGPIFNSLIAPVGCRVHPDSSGKLAMKWECPSLISAFAQMATHDILNGGSRLIQCSECGCPAMTTAYQARYCSRRCGDRNRTNRFRRKRNKQQSDSKSLQNLAGGTPDNERID